MIYSISNINVYSDRKETIVSIVIEWVWGQSRLMEIEFCDFRDFAESLSWRSDLDVTFAPDT